MVKISPFLKKIKIDDSLYFIKVIEQRKGFKVNNQNPTFHNFSCKQFQYHIVSELAYMRKLILDQ